MVFFRTSDRRSDRGLSDAARSRRREQYQAQQQIQAARQASADLHTEAVLILE